jgi:hypothetical protein
MPRNDIADKAVGIGAIAVVVVFFIGLFFYLRSTPGKPATPPAVTGH